MTRVGDGPTRRSAHGCVPSLSEHRPRGASVGFRRGSVRQTGRADGLGSVSSHRRQVRRGALEHSKRALKYLRSAPADETRFVTVVSARKGLKAGALANTGARVLHPGVGPIAGAHSVCVEVVSLTRPSKRTRIGPPCPGPARCGRLVPGAHAGLARHRDKSLAVLPRDCRRTLATDRGEGATGAGMIGWETLALAIHLLGAIVWVGGTISLGVVVQVLRRQLRDRPQEYRRLATQIGRAFGWLMWPALLATLLTGWVNLAWYAPGGNLGLVLRANPWIQASLVLSTVMVVFAASHTFLVGPRLRRSREEGRPEVELAALRGLNHALEGGTLVTALAIVGVMVVLGSA